MQQKKEAIVWDSFFFSNRIKLDRGTEWLIRELNCQRERDRYLLFSFQSSLLIIGCYNRISSSISSDMISSHYIWNCLPRCFFVFKKISIYPSAETIVINVTCIIHKKVPARLLRLIKSPCLIRLFPSLRARLFDM